MRYEDMQVGMAAERRRVISDELVRAYADLTEDFNPLHVDDEVAKRSRFGGRIAHGMLSAGLVSAVLGMDMPGPGALWLTQSIKFTRPVMIGDTLTTRVEVIELIPNKRRARLATTCRNQSGELTLDGEALIQMMEDTG